MPALREIYSTFAFDWDAAELKKADRAVDAFSGDVRGLVQASERLRGKFGQTTGPAKGLGGTIDGLAGSIGGVVAALTGGALAAGVSRFAEQLDTFDDLSAQTGILTDQLQLLGYAAKVNGSSQEEMFGALTRLQGAFGRTADAGSPLTKILKDMGVQTEDAAGGPRKLAEVLPEILGGFSKLESEAAQSQAAVALFGRSGARLLPILRQGEAGLAALNEEFQAFGGPVSGDAVAKAGEFRDNLVRLDTAFFALKGNLGAAVFPQLSKVVNMTAQGVAAISEWSKATTLAETATLALAGSLTSALLPALLPLISGGLKFAAVFLAVDDLVAFLQGQDSVIGRILDGWFGEGTADVVRDWVNDALSEFGRLWGDAEAMQKAFTDSSLTTWQGWAAALAGFFQDASAGFPVFYAAAERALTRVGLDLERAVLGWMQTWNAFIGGLHLPDAITGALQIDTSDNMRGVQAAENALQGKIDAQTAAELGTFGPKARNQLGSGMVSGKERRGVTVNPDGSLAGDLPSRGTGGITLPGGGDRPTVEVMPGPFRQGLEPSFSMVQNSPIVINLPAGTDVRNAQAIGRAAQQGQRDANRAAHQALVQRK